MRAKKKKSPSNKGETAVVLDIKKKNSPNKVALCVEIKSPPQKGGHCLHHNGKKKQPKE
jgi:hypothetical protein